MSGYNGNTILSLGGLDELWEHPFSLHFVGKQAFALPSGLLTCRVTEVGVSVLQRPGVTIVVGSVLHSAMLSSTVPWMSLLQEAQRETLHW